MEIGFNAGRLLDFTNRNSRSVINNRETFGERHLAAYTSAADRPERDVVPYLLIFRWHKSDSRTFVRTRTLISNIL